MTIGDRIKQARTLRGVTRPELAKATGIPYPTLAGIENGDQGNSTQLDVVAAELRVRVAWLRTGKGNMELPPARPDSDVVEVLGYKQAAALGGGALPDEYAETHSLAFREQSLRRKGLRPDKLGVCYGSGDSMVPRIHDGDAILFNMDETELEDDKLFVVSHDGMLYAKQLSLIGGRWFMVSLNEAERIKPVLIDEFDHFRVHGKVRWIGSWED